MAARSQRIAISRLGRSKAAGSFLDIPRGAGFAVRSDSDRAFRGPVIFGGVSLRTIFSRVAIHESISGVFGGRAVHAAFYRSIRSGDGCEHRAFHAATANPFSNRVSESSRQSAQRFTYARLRRADWNRDRVQASRSGELVFVDRAVSDLRCTGQTMA